MRLQATRTSVTSAGGASDAFYSAAGSKPTLDQRFEKDKSLRDKISGKNLITFTRASGSGYGATYVDSDGLIKTSPVNLLTHSQQFDQWSKGADAVITTNTTTAPDGTSTADRVYFPNSGSRYIAKSVPLDNGKTYTFSIWAKAVTPGTNNEFFPKINSPTPHSPAANFVATSEWKRFSFTFTHTDASATGVNVFPLNINFNTVTVDVYLWGAQLQEGALTDYIHTQGSASGAPRFDHDPVTGESLGLLIEEERTNLLTYSEEFNQSVWVKQNNPSVTPNAAVAPDGTQTADKVEFSATNQWLYQSVALTGTVTFSCYVRSVSGNVSTEMRIYNGNDATQVKSFTATTEWQRVELSATLTHTGNTGFYPVRGLANGDEFYVWGAQLEANATFPTSYIPTDGTAGGITRSPDIVSIEGSEFSNWFNTDASTVYWEGNVIAGASGQYTLWGIQDGTSRNNGMLMTRRSSAGSRFNHYNSTTDDVDLNGPLWTDNSYRKLSAAIGQSSAGFADSGSLIGTDTVYQLPSASDALDSLYLGKAFGGGLSKYNVHIKRFAYFPTRRTDQELIKMTS